MQVIYRARQTWNTITAIPEKDDIDQVRKILSPDLMSIFLGLQPGEQAHSYWVYNQLRQNGETNHNLLVAALLHDVGKSLHPLRLWERIVIVLGKTFFPQEIKAWGQGDPHGFLRPFVISEKHPDWGADMAAQAGASQMTVSIIRRHQEPQNINPNEISGKNLFVTTNHLMEKQLLQRLQQADNKS
ncbi:HD domain-containing protein [Chloroflexota bacterium]